MRDQLPYLVPENQSYSIWAILKEAIGKDLSRITMPIFLNEPISMLQKTSDLMHYYNVLRDGLERGKNDSLKRLAYIAIFIVCQYSVIDTRNRKPFNPILGETYELVTPEWRWIAEQVSHHPPISAFYCEGKGFNTTGNTNLKNYFWGGSLELRVVGL